MKKKCIGFIKILIIANLFVSVAEASPQFWVVANLKDYDIGTHINLIGGQVEVTSTNHDGVLINTTASPWFAYPLVINCNIPTLLPDGSTIYFRDIMFIAKNGDINLDGLVDNSDYFNVIAHMGKTGAVWFEGDLDRDGIVSVTDFNILSEYIKHQNIPANTTSVPEPSFMFISLFLFISNRNFIHRG